MNINEFLEEHKEIELLLDGEYELRKLAPKVECADGFTMSVQVSETHYCDPRKNNAGHYKAVEVGFPSEKDDLLMPFCEEESNPTGTVYGFVPVRVVDKVIVNHGGFKQ